MHGRRSQRHGQVRQSAFYFLRGAPDYIVWGCSGNGMLVFKIKVVLQFQWSETQDGQGRSQGGPPFFLKDDRVTSESCFSSL